MDKYNKALADGTTVDMPVNKKGKADTLNAGFVILTDDYTITAADKGKKFAIATDAKTINLPATIADFDIEIYNIGAAGNNIVKVSPVAADGISGTFTLAASVVVCDGTVNKDIINTKATSVCGDHVKLIGTGVTGVTAWLVRGGSGIWAREA